MWGPRYFNERPERCGVQILRALTNGWENLPGRAPRSLHPHPTIHEIVPRAHHGNGERLILEVTLVMPQDALPFDPDYDPHPEESRTETQINGGAFLEDVCRANRSLSTPKQGPWGSGPGRIARPYGQSA
ncbi:hypothetical protein BJX63DRAFT_83988 [Aspergillus granulosus]|uniref:Uncharacterized protein n=1 Tax=Aspergillus granulosus TaxID=176169 RepID=A0ABR4HRK6_9EURO